MKIGIVGATGAVGRAMIEQVSSIKDSSFSEIDLHLFASRKSAGQILKFRDKEISVETLTEESMKEKFDYLLFSSGGSISKHFSPIAAQAGSIIIDNSSAFRSDKNIPLVVPELNSHTLKDYQGIIANPNCSTIQMVIALADLHNEYSIDEIVTSTYQSVSGAGNNGIMSLINEEKNINTESCFSAPIRNNVIPQIGDITDNGYCSEELKMLTETQKIFDCQEINVSATTIRVPVIYGHTIAIHTKFKKKVDISKAEYILSMTEHVKLHKNTITPKSIESSTEREYSHVCRLRKGLDDYSLSFVNIAHNVFVGAATNAVRIMIKHNKINKG